MRIVCLLVFVLLPHLVFAQSSIDNPPTALTSNQSGPTFIGGWHCDAQNADIRVRFTSLEGTIEVATAATDVRLGDEVTADSFSIAADSSVTLGRVPKHAASASVTSGEIPLSDTWRGYVVRTDTTNGQIVAAVSGSTHYVGSIIVDNDSATATTVQIKSANVTIGSMPAPADGGSIVTFNPPFKLVSGEAFNLASRDAVTSIRFTSTGWTVKD